MARKILDDDLLEWEVYATTGKHGFPEGAHVVFHCLTDMARRSRFVAIDGDRAEAERMIEEAPATELFGLFERAEAIR